MKMIFALAISAALLAGCSTSSSGGGGGAQPPGANPPGEQGPQVGQQQPQNGAVSACHVVAQQYCVEAANVDANKCQAERGQVLAACPTAGMVATCTLQNNAKIYWYGNPAQKADFDQQCLQAGGTN